MKYLLIILSLVFSCCLHSIGFTEETIVKVHNGYKKIGEVQAEDQVICYDFQGKCVERPVLAVVKTAVQDMVSLQVRSTILLVAADQQFYLPVEKTWIQAKDIRPGMLLLSSCQELIPVEQIQHMQADKSKTLYDLTVAEYHNFCVSEADIHVHNIVIEITLGWFAGDFLVTGAIGIIGGLVLNAAWNPHHKDPYIPTDYGYRFDGDTARHANSYTQQPEQELSSTSCFNDHGEQTTQGCGDFRSYGDTPTRSIFPSSTSDRLDGTTFPKTAQEKPTVYTANRDPNWRKMTNKEAREVAVQQGWLEVKDYPMNSHGQPVFRQGKNYITPDRDGHKGGRWKVFINGNIKRRKTYKDGALTVEVGD